MAQRHALLGQQRLGLGAAQAGLEHGGHRLVVDRDQPLHADEVERDQPGVALAPRDQAAGDRRTATERHHGDVVLDGPRQHRGHVVVGARAHDDVRRVGQVAGARTQQVGRRLAAGAQPARGVVGQHVLGADDGAERCDEVGRQAGVRQPRILDRGPLGQGPEGQLDEAAGGLRQVAGTGRVAPTGGMHLGLHDSGHVLQCDT